MYLGWREIRWARGRFLLVGGVIMLITVLVGLLSGLTRGLGEQSTSALTGLRADGLVLGADEIASSRLPASLVPGGVPLGLSTLRASGGAGAGAVEVIGVPVDSDIAPDARGVGRGAVVLSEAARELLGPGQVRIGDTAYDVAVTRGEASYAHLPVVWTTLADWQHLTGSGGRATAIAWSGGAPSPPGRYEVRTIAQSLSAVGSYSAEHGSLLMIRGFLLVISALVVGAFFTVWTFQRSSDIAVLKALGASTRSLVADTLGQAAVVLVASVGAGLLVTLAVGTTLGALAGSSVPFSLDATGLAVPLVLLVLLGLLGAGLAVRTVTSVDPLTALAST